jgi:hypothetical protein
MVWWLKTRNNWTGKFVVQPVVCRGKGYVGVVYEYARPELRSFTLAWRGFQTPVVALPGRLEYLAWPIARLLNRRNYGRKWARWFQ